MSLQSLFPDTIFALSSGAPPCGVALVRITGAGVRPMLEAICGGVPEPRRAVLRTIQDEATTIDRGLVLFFAAPDSFTGEDCAEFHLHGGRAVVAALLDTLGRRKGFRLAEPGEFTRRAFLCGKLDLTQAEALADLINAETESQRLFALENAAGAQAEIYRRWRVVLIDARALVEAELDFSDEDDVADGVADTVSADLLRLTGELDAHLAGFHAAEILRDGFKVVILGRPNAGKSSLLNMLARRDVAIVSTQPGTTRDLVEVQMDIGGVKVSITDTAGLRDGGDAIERIGMARAAQAARDADLVLSLYDLSSTGMQGQALLSEGEAARLVVGSKADRRNSDRIVDVATSAVTGEGLDELLKMIGDAARDALAGRPSVLPSRQRHVGLLRACRGHLEAAAGMRGGPHELIAEELRLGSDALGRIVGKIDVEDVLDSVFGQFCIGK